jgi:fructuronate reductase
VSSRLNVQALARLPADVRRPAYDFQHLGIGIVHLGIGAFHRAHQAVYTEDAIHKFGGDWGILGASLRHAEVRSALDAQQHLYTVETLAEEPSYQVIAAVRDALSAGDQRPRLLSALASARTHIVTLTITEKGYCLGANGELDFSHPDIMHDLELPESPRSAIGWLAAGLVERRRLHAGPVTILSCDNLQANGTKLGRAVAAFLDRSRKGSLAWLQEGASFPQTVVDCIVPAATESSRERVREALGLEDLASVQREPFSQWVIEDRFAGPRPEWQKTGVQIVTNVQDYARLKLHVLNSCHSALAYLGLPRGYVFVREAMMDAQLARFLEDLVSLEIAPALEPLAVPDYWATVRARFANRRIDHRLSQIAQDGAQKLAERIFPIMVANAERGVSVHRLARVVRGWIDMTRGDHAAALDDPTLLPPDIRLNPALRAAIAGPAA